jgi:hypothetical protein
MAGRRAWFRFEFELLRHDVREWIVMTGDRRLVSLFGLLSLGVIFVPVMESGYVPLEKETPILFLLFALIGANFTLIAIVTSLSQFVLSRRLESPGEVREKTRETISYRRDVGETIDQEIMPVRPDAFFLTLYQHIDGELARLDGASEYGRTKRARTELAELVRGLDGHVDYVIKLLQRPSSGLKHALFTSLTADYEEYVHRTWYLQTEHSTEFTESVAVPLERLVETLEHIEVASRMFRTIFIESEVSELSRLLLYIGLPVQLSAVVVMLLYTASGAQPPVPLSTLHVLVPAVVMAGFTPFIVLSAYVIRLTVVARRTADTFPFSSQLTTPLEWKES